PRVVRYVALVPSPARFLRRMPQLVRDDAPRLVLLTHPLGLGPEEATPPARLVILPPLAAVPHPFAAIDEVAQHLANRCRSPRGRRALRPPRPRRSDAFGIEAMREGPEAKPLPCIAFEDPDHDGGDLRIHLELIPARDRMPVRVLARDNRRGPVAERRSARGELAIEAPTQTAVRVLPDLLQVLGGHHAHDPRTHVVEVE